MKLGDIHLGFCTNIYTGSNWKQIKNQCLEHVSVVKAGVSPNREFGFGLWLPVHAAAELKKEKDRFKHVLAKNGLYIFTINAFPYDGFHTGIVKERVYFPDWSSDQRVEYTCDVADLLSFFLPEGVSGSISTVPVTYGKICPAGAKENLLLTAAHLRKIELETGFHIRLGLEPEPDCFLESIDECLSFFDDLQKMDPGLTQRYLGICIDTCHMAVCFESPTSAIEKLRKSGIGICKIQLSSALVYTHHAENDPNIIMKFNDGRFLHQTRVKEKSKITVYSDLPEAANDFLEGEWRVHCHVPLHYKGDSKDLRTTADKLDTEFYSAAARACMHFEIETYTFSVLPGQNKNIDQSIIGEFNTVLKKMRAMNGIR